MQVDFAIPRTISHYAFRSIPILDFALQELVGRTLQCDIQAHSAKVFAH